MLGFSTYAALLPGLRDEWHLSNAEAGVIAGTFFAGYVATVSYWTALTDRLDGRRVYLAGSFIAAGASAGFGLFASGLVSALLFQMLLGVGIAATYMPGLRLLSDRLSGAGQSRSIATYTSFFGIGTALSLAAAGVLASSAGWRVAFIVGGARHHSQTYNAGAARLYGSTMLVAALSLMVPSAFSRFLAPDETVRAESLLNIALALLLLAAYALYLLFMLKTHPDEFAGDGDRAGEAHGPRWSLGRAIGGLVLASLLAAWMSEILVGAAEGTGEALGMSQVFIGIVFLAIVGGAAESSSAVAMASRNKMDLCIGIALGSCLQIALFVAPVLVLLSYFIGPTPLDLQFWPGTVFMVLIATMTTALVTTSGRSTWFLGVLVLMVYLIFAMTLYLLPDQA